MILDDIDERRMTKEKESLIRARNEVALLKGNTQTKTSPRTIKLLLNEIDALRESLAFCQKGYESLCLTKL